MPTPPRRIVTGHDPAGVSVVLSDGPPPAERTLPDGAVFYELWSTTENPARLTAREADPGLLPLSIAPPANGTKVRVNVFPPGLVSPMHRTRSVDYGIVLEGAVVLVLENSEVSLGPGDVVVQRGTNHRWENRSEQSARMAFVMIAGEFSDELLTTLDPDVLDHLMDAVPDAPAAPGT